MKRLWHSLTSATCKNIREKTNYFLHVLIINPCKLHVVANKTGKARYLRGRKLHLKQRSSEKIPRIGRSQLYNKYRQVSYLTNNLCHFIEEPDLGGPAWCSACVCVFVCVCLFWSFSLKYPCPYPRHEIIWEYGGQRHIILTSAPYEVGQRHTKAA